MSFLFLSLFFLSFSVPKMFIKIFVLLPPLLQPPTPPSPPQQQQLTGRVFTFLLFGSDRLLPHWLAVVLLCYKHVQTSQGRFVAEINLLQLPQHDTSLLLLVASPLTLSVLCLLVNSLDVFVARVNISPTLSDLLVSKSSRCLVVVFDSSLIAVNVNLFVY